MKRILLVLALVLAAGLLFAEVGSDPLGDPAGNLVMSRWAQQVQAKLAIQNQLMAQVRLEAQADQPAAPESQDLREAPSRFQLRSGDCDSDCDGEPIQTRDQLQDGTGDGTPDQLRTGRPE